MAKKKRQAKKSFAKNPAVKKLTGEFKGFVDEYKDKLILLLVSFFETRARDMITWVKDIGHLKRKFKAAMFFISLAIVGIFLIFFGIADYVAYQWPVLANGSGKILIGIIIIVIGYIIKKIA
ncbi:MAG: hypothetical protein KAT77_00085 [Nanoarchaeota archaeon]|nr:hypothetical protein [Nanoarchaeota archaeon]